MPAWGPCRSNASLDVRPPCRVGSVQGVGSATAQFSAFGLRYRPNYTEFNTFLHKLQTAAKAFADMGGDLPADLGRPLGAPVSAMMKCAKRLARRHHSDKFSSVEGPVAMQPPGLIATLSGYLDWAANPPCGSCSLWSSGSATALCP